MPSGAYDSRRGIRCLALKYLSHIIKKSKDFIEIVYFLKCAELGPEQELICEFQKHRGDQLPAQFEGCYKSKQGWIRISLSFHLA